VEVAAAAAGGNEIMKGTKTMKTSSLRFYFSILLFRPGLVSLSVAMLVAIANAQGPATTKAKSFATAEAAANALVDAAEKFDEAALTEILGPDSYDIIHTG